MCALFQAQAWTSLKHVVPTPVAVLLYRGLHIPGILHRMGMGDMGVHAEGGIEGMWGGYGGDMGRYGGGYGVGDTILAGVLGRGGLAELPR